ncbi:hypothetical protein BOX15_Mlig033178g3, partial [Macrostomum lignano]
RRSSLAKTRHCSLERINCLTNLSNRGTMPLLLLSLLLAAAASCLAMPPDWNPPSLPGGSGGINVSPLAAASRCVPIPRSLELCANIGYAEMRLPNMLNHDSVTEVQDNTKQWLPLTRTECHRDVRVLLCSVYAPVCIHQLPDKQIKPCRSLCEAVRQPCAAFMRGFGFQWPEMLNCSQFPPDSDLMCIRSSVSSTAECLACREKVTYESIIANFCVNKVVVKARLKTPISGDSAPDSGATRLRLRGRVRHFKAEEGGAAGRQLRSAVVDTAGCRCAALDSSSAASSSSASSRRKKFLLMGSMSPDGNLKVAFLAEWDRSNRQFRRAIRQIRRSQRRSRRRPGGSGGNLCRGGASIDNVDGAGGRRLPEVLPQPRPKLPDAGSRGGGGGRRGGRRGGKKRNKKKRRNGGGRGGKRKKNRRNGGRKGAGADAERRGRRGRRGRRQRRNRQRGRTALPTLPPRRPAQPPQPPPGGSRYSYDSYYYSDYKN